MATVPFQALEAFKESSALVKMHQSFHNPSQAVTHGGKPGRSRSRLCHLLGSGCGAENSRLRRVVTHGDSSPTPSQNNLERTGPGYDFSPVLNPHAHSLGVRPTVTWGIYKAKGSRCR